MAIWDKIFQCKALGAVVESEHLVLSCLGGCGTCLVRLGYSEKMESYSLALHLVLSSLLPDLQDVNKPVPMLPPSSAAVDRGQEQICPQLICLPLHRGLITPEAMSQHHPPTHSVYQVLSHSSERCG